jgi:hypothetical protein
VEESTGASLRMEQSFDQAGCVPFRRGVWIPCGGISGEAGGCRWWGILGRLVCLDTPFCRVPACSRRDTGVASVLGVSIPLLGDGVRTFLLLPSAVGRSCPC